MDPLYQLVDAARYPARYSRIRDLFKRWISANMDESVIYKAITDFYVIQIEETLADEYNNNMNYYDIHRQVSNTIVYDTVMDILPESITDDFRYWIRILQRSYPWLIEFKPETNISAVTPTTIRMIAATHPYITAPTMPHLLHSEDISQSSPTRCTEVYWNDVGRESYVLTSQAPGVPL